MKWAELKTVVLSAAVIVAAVLAQSCSPKKNTAASRRYQAFITRYNIYYNGDTHYKETLSEMEKTYEDDYSRLLFVHPAEARADEKAPQPTGDFTRSIEKAQKAIQLRSIKKRPNRKPGQNNNPEYKAWLRRDEYNPFLHNAWMMMGRSQFLNGDFLGAASTFFYVSKHFNWLPATVTEAKLYQARAYCSLDWIFEAETILTRIKPDQLTSKGLRHLYNLTMAEFYIKSKDNAAAIPFLVEAIKTSKGYQKIRLNFLLGQLYTLEGDKTAAYKAFDAAGSASSASYRTKFNARVKQSEVFTGDDITPEVKALKRMTRYDRNKEYLDQIYYAIGNLYLSRRDTARAIENYETAIEESTRSGIDKAIAQLTLGTLYYEQGKYEKAQPCYSEAISVVPESYPDYKQLKKRSDFLDELAVYSQNVTLQDSLLKLSYMTPDEQRAVAEKLIAELKKKEAEEAEQARREAYLADQAAQGTTLGENSKAPTTFTMNTDNSWYFYNPSTVTAGKTEFQRRWGSRKLEDNWRRRNKASFAFDLADNGDNDLDEEEDDTEGSSTETDDETVDKDAAQRQSDPHYVEYYLAQIPKDDQERMVANDVIQEGLYNMGVILKDKLDDFPAAKREFDGLLTRYPDNIYRLDTYYNLYLMAVRSGDLAQAERYRLMIVAEFPDSPYGRAMTDPRYIDNLREMDQRQEKLYADALEAYLDNRNGDVHKAYKEMEREFPMSKIMPKFMFIDALSYVTENKPEEFKSALTTLLERYPDTDLTPYAASYLKGLAQGRKLNAGATNMRGMIWDIRLGNESTAVDSDNPLEFELNPDDKQLFILLYPTDEVSSNALLYDIARHNFTSFVVKDFDLEQMNFGRLGLLIIKPFDNLREINHYRSVMAADKTLDLPPQVRPVVISQKNFDTLLQGGGSFDDYFRFAADKTYRDTEESVLPPEFFGQSEGIPDDLEQRAEDAGQPDIQHAERPIEQSDGRHVEQSADSQLDNELSQPLDNYDVDGPVQPEPTLPEPAQAAVPGASNGNPDVSDAPTDAPGAPATPTAQAEPSTPTAPTAEKPPTAPATGKPQPAREPDYPVGSEGDDPLFDF